MQNLKEQAEKQFQSTFGNNTFYIPVDVDKITINSEIARDSIIEAMCDFARTMCEKQKAYCVGYLLESEDKIEEIMNICDGR